MTRFECDKCGACCRGHLIVQADELDVLREPRLLQADPHWARMSIDPAAESFQVNAVPPEKVAQLRASDGEGESAADVDDRTSEPMPVGHCEPRSQSTLF